MGDFCELSMQMERLFFLRVCIFMWDVGFIMGLIFLCILEMWVLCCYF